MLIKTFQTLFNHYPYPHLALLATQQQHLFLHALQYTPLTLTLRHITPLLLLPLL